MQMVKRTVLFLFVVLFSLAIFAPKRELYYRLEEYLVRYDIVIDNEEIESGPFTLKLMHPELYVKGIKVAKIQEISLLSLLFYTTVKAKEIVTDRSLRRWMPGEIGLVALRYQLLKPRIVSIQAKGPFGTFKGYLSLKKRLLHLDLTEEKSIQALKPLLKKGEKGWYYESSF